MTTPKTTYLGFMLGKIIKALSPQFETNKANYIFDGIESEIVDMEDGTEYVLTIREKKPKVEIHPKIEIDSEMIHAVNNIFSKPL